MARNIVSISPEETLYPTFSSLPVGALFRYKQPWNENNVYMKTDIYDKCILLNIGCLYAVDADRMVVPVKGVVAIQTPNEK